MKIENAEKEELADLQGKWTAAGLLSAGRTAGNPGNKIEDESGGAPIKTISRENLAGWAESDDAWLAKAVQTRVERFDRRGTEPLEPFEPFEPFEFFQNRNFH